ncbi:MAG TPA: glutathione S-transferase family protein [Polyangiaceae bacterium]|nr:glutathione S-transferase family protein [Polyangiaceae bacterium]
MNLYHHPMSLNARRAVMAALHLRAPVDLVLVDLQKGHQRSVDHLRRNPNGKVPVLEDGDFVLWESNAIMQYLADVTPGQSVYPQGAKERADVNRWLFWSAHHFTPAVGVLNWERAVKPLIGLGNADPTEVSRGEKLVIECGRVLDTHLAGKDWITQGRLTLADFALAAPLMAMTRAKLPLGDFVHIRGWFARVRDLDAWQRTNPGQDAPERATLSPETRAR